MTRQTFQRRLDDLELQLKGLVHVRALLEVKGVSAAELDAHTAAIARVRDELSRLTGIRGPALEGAL